jgi:hypothetical protein
MSVHFSPAPCRFGSDRGKAAGAPPVETRYREAVRVTPEQERPGVPDCPRFRCSQRAMDLWMEGRVHGRSDVFGAISACDWMAGYEY